MADAAPSQAASATAGRRAEQEKKLATAKEPLKQLDSAALLAAKQQRDGDETQLTLDQERLLRTYDIVWPEAADW